MNISFEIEVDTRTGEFLCYCLVDGQRCCDLITYHTGPPTSCSSVATVWPSFTRKSIGSDCFSQVTSSDNQSASSEPNKPFKADYGIIGVGCAVSKTAPLARELAARSLVDWCREKQPIVGLTPSCSISSKDSELSEYNFAFVIFDFKLSILALLSDLSLNFVHLLYLTLFYSFLRVGWLTSAVS
ncbi:unnamed protein product [Protopolystoma xenopodis]|uniref:Uncharacterized protein n=1 Tax=Protopolystoma xenopodis TaxID=117903 RepID=A0A3S5BYP7_9PLAT|nr:unnamed protein product [Protopolystoma xenopodis]